MEVERWPRGKASDWRETDLSLNLAFPVGLFLD